MNTQQTLPPVSYIMPVLNEVDYLETALRMILEQEYPNSVEIVLALGPSTDGTNALAAKLAAEDPRITLVENPQSDIPVGLNLAIANSHHPVIVRVDAHSEIAPNYTVDAVSSLLASGAVNVGGQMRAAGHTETQQLIAHAYNSPYGLGGGTYHSDGDPQPAESAYLGVFFRDAVVAVGGYDNTIRRGEDWELNLRLRKAGHTVWFDPRLRVVYRPRKRWRDLAKQFFATGVWRAVITKKYPRDTPWRFFVPGALVLALLAAVVVAGVDLGSNLAGSPIHPLWRLTAVIPAAYLFGLLWAAASNRQLRQGGPVKQLVMRAKFAWTLAVMHLSWGTGFLVGALRGGGDTVDRSRLG